MSSGFASLQIQLSAERHFIRNSRLFRARQRALCCWKHDVVFNPNVLSVNDDEIADGLPKSPCLWQWKTALVETSQSKGMNLSVQGISPPMFVLERVQSCERAFDVRAMNLSEAREQRFFFVCRVLGSRLLKITQSGFESRTDSICKRGIDYLSHPLERSEKHFNASMAVRQESCGLGKVMGLCSNLNGHFYLNLSIDDTFLRRLVEMPGSSIAAISGLRESVAALLVRLRGTTSMVSAWISFFGRTADRGGWVSICFQPLFFAFARPW